MPTIIQSLLIAGPIYYLALGLLILSRAKLTFTRQPPKWVLAKAYGAALLLSPWFMLMAAGKGSTMNIIHRDDE